MRCTRTKLPKFMRAGLPQEQTCLDCWYSQVTEEAKLNQETHEVRYENRQLKCTFFKQEGQPTMLNNVKKCDCFWKDCRVADYGGGF